MALEGVHHVTAITADAPRNVDFYARLLGLRLIKKTVNFDQPDVYHLYYGDERATPGSVLFELASRDVGFDIDEPAESLGHGLMLPPQHEGRREELRGRLTPIANPRDAT